MKAIFAMLLVLVVADSSFAAVNSGVNQDDPNNFTNTQQRIQAVAPKSCGNRAGKDLLKQIEPNGPGADATTRTAKGSRAGSST